MKRNHHFYRLFILFWVLGGGGIVFASSLTAEAKDNIRVLIIRDVPQLTIQGTELALRDLRTGRMLFYNKKYSSLTVHRGTGSFLRVSGQPISAKALVLTSAQGSMTIHGHRYQNRLKLFPDPNGGLLGVNELPIEDYLAGLINCELPTQWPMEVLKVQAVIARTYATYQKRNRPAGLFDVDSTVMDQVYEGIEKIDARSRQAVKETEGELLLYHGQPIFAVYHACCGGKTDSPKYLWTEDFPYLQPTACSFCLDFPHFLWNYQIQGDPLAKTLAAAGLWGSQILEVEVAERNETKRVLQVTIKSEKEQMKISGKEFRRLLGYDFIRSTYFIVKESGGMFTFSGLGWGHGVGLCQWGARGMAESGAAYHSILKYYYRDVEIGKKLR
ncbi:MAG: SpoIID/LytB domain-containing protein [Deltaproteobacteria bacterium]|nr:SpoIID/LytB domain-containing protein [Deltaproteobacteria bacterium]